MWTGDSSRHDSDERIPRTATEAIKTNNLIATKFAETFGNGLDPEDPKHEMSTPVIPTFGNNDFLPHNIFYAGPNKWLRTYQNIWDNFIPEEQRHGFQRGGWFYVEAIPNKLAVFSLNTMYFFTNNAAVDGCSLKSEPGFEHMEWLRIQLQTLRNRGMKAILTGHVPPAHTESKKLWDETCWQKYTLYLQQFRDVVVTGLYGHMNVDHFMIQDTEDIDILQTQPSAAKYTRSPMDEELTINSATEYLEELRQVWANLPKIPSILAKEFDEDEDVSEDIEAMDSSKKKSKKPKKNKDLKKIGGPWGERFQVTHVSPSVVPNYFPTMRVFEYNITGLDSTATWASQPIIEVTDTVEDWIREEMAASSDSMVEGQHVMSDNGDALPNSFKKGGKKHKKPKNPDLVIPPSPTKGSPPGPAYSPQTLTLLGYTQYFANLTNINNDIQNEEIAADRWREGKHKGKKPKDQDPHPKKFEFQVEYDTFSDKIYKLKDLTVMSHLKLAYRLGKYQPEKGDSILDEPIFEDSEQELDDLEYVDQSKKGRKGGKHKKKKKHHEKNRVWLAFIKRAFISTQEAKDILSLNDDNSSSFNQQSELHDGEI